MVKFVSNREIIDKTKELVEKIKDMPLYKEYNLLKSKMYNNKEINDKINEIKLLQKKYVKSGFLDIEIENKINKLESELQDVSLYRKFISKENELKRILSIIEEGLNVTLSNLVNY